MSHDTARSLADIAALIGSAVLLAAAFKRRSHALNLIAVFVAATAAAGVLVIGWLTFPAMYLGWRQRKGRVRGLGPVLIASIAASTLLLAWRIPWPSPVAADARATGTA